MSTVISHEATAGRSPEQPVLSPAELIAAICTTQRTFDLSARSRESFLSTLEKEEAYSAQVAAARAYLNGVAESKMHLTGIEARARDVSAMVCLFRNLESERSLREDLSSLFEDAAVDETVVVKHFKQGMMSMAINTSQSQYFDPIDSVHSLPDLDIFTLDRNPAREYIVSYHIRDLSEQAYAAGILPADVQE